MRPAPPRAPLLVLSAAALALAVAIPGCFDWDGYLSRCHDAGNCLGPANPDGSRDGGADGGSDGGTTGGGGDGGDGGTTGGGGDGGDGGTTGAGGIGAPCSGPQECRTGACTGDTCVCSFDSPCATSADCCLGQICGIGNTCVMDTALPLCGADTSFCTLPGECCSNSCGDMMCGCSPNGVRCNNGGCCDSNAICSAGNHCCAPPTAPCVNDDDCCSRVCGATICL